MPSRNNWPTRARGVIASKVACAQDTAGGAGGGGVVVDAGAGLADAGVGTGRAGTGGVEAQANATAHAAAAPPARNGPRNCSSTPPPQHAPASAVTAAWPVSRLHAAAVPGEHALRPHGGGCILTGAEIEAFVESGFVHLAGAFPRAVADRCRAQLWQATGCDPDDSSTWTEPVIRLGDFSAEPFREAANTPVLHEAFDQLVGPGRWQRRNSLGSVPVRFPSGAVPGNDGWHLEGSFTGDAGEYRVNLHSRGRALLMLFLFSDTGADDAPTRIRVGSHHDVPALLRDAGEPGRE
ncbi:MAG: hypothetical protein ACRDSH_20205 [Pseudonocardiaceae bacterium]